MFGWNVEPDRSGFFRGNLREPAMRTNSSITFAYRPATRPIDRHLLAEEERTEIAAEEATRLHEIRSDGRKHLALSRCTADRAATIGIAGPARATMAGDSGVMPRWQR